MVRGYERIQTRAVYEGLSSIPNENSVLQLVVMARIIGLRGKELKLDADCVIHRISARRINILDRSSGIRKEFMQIRGVSQIAPGC